MGLSASVLMGLGNLYVVVVALCVVVLLVYGLWGVVVMGIHFFRPVMGNGEDLPVVGLVELKREAERAVILRRRFALRLRMLSWGWYLSCSALLGLMLLGLLLLGWPFASLEGGLPMFVEQTPMMFLVVGLVGVGGMLFGFAWLTVDVKSILAEPMSRESPFLRRWLVWLPWVFLFGMGFVRLSSHLVIQDFSKDEHLIIYLWLGAVGVIFSVLRSFSRSLESGAGWMFLVFAWLWDLGVAWIPLSIALVLLWWGLKVV